MRTRITAITATVFFTVICPAIVRGQEDYFAVFMDGKKIGYAIRSRAEDGQLVRTTEAINMTVTRLDIPMTINLSETCVETPQGQPVGFESIQDMSGLTAKISGTVDKDGSVQIATNTGGGAQQSTMAWPGGAVMAEGLRLLLMKTGLKEGTTFTAKVFSASVCEVFDATIRIGGREKVNLLGRVVPLTVVTTTLNMPQAGQLTTTSYIDDNFRAQKDTIPIMGLEIELITCEKDFALGMTEDFEIITRLSVQCPRPLTAADLAGAVRYELAPTSQTARLSIPGSDNQIVRPRANGGVSVTVRPAVLPREAPLGYKGGDPEIIEATKPTSYVQSDNNTIRRLAAEAVGQTRNAALAAKKIEAFVADYITDKNFSVGYASAAEVAESRQGDCTEFAVLTAALCRAVGIPARVVFGIAYIEDFAGLGPRFGGHAWVEACIGNRWIGLDSAFKSAGLGGYDAGHIALAFGNGEPKDFFAVVSTIGQFKIESVTTSSAR